MPFSNHFKIVLWNSAETALYLVLALAGAFGLSFVEDLFRHTHRSELLIAGAHWGAIIALIVDLVAWCLLVLIGFYRLLRRPLQDENGP
jgi:hypothetical protein